MESGAEGYFEMKIKFKNEIITQNKNDNNKPIIREKHLNKTRNEFSANLTKNSQNEHNEPQNENKIEQKRQNFSFNPIERNQMEKQSKLMEKIFIKAKLKSMDDWINISTKKMIRNGGEKLLEYYEGNMKNLLLNIYPNFPWEEENLKLKCKFYNINFKSIEKQREFMDKLFIKFKLNSLDEWLNILKERIKDEKGFNLLRKYNFDLKKLLLSIYPNYPWLSLSFKIHPTKYFKSIENQQKFMDKLFKKFNLNSFDDWKNISREKIKKNGGESLVTTHYKDNFHLLISTIYPNFPWYSQEKINSLFLYDKVKFYIEKYSITQKKDWFRLPSSIDGSNFDLYQMLLFIYPSEKWKKSNFSFRTKKTTQRLLFSFSQKIYPSLLIFENYFHPKGYFELDIFIPALQLALEYQGEQHYDDMPAAFSGFELLQKRDEEKEKLAKDHSIKIIYIPYWWDQSLSTLQSSLQS